MRSPFVPSNFVILIALYQLRLSVKNSIYVKLLLTAIFLYSSGLLTYNVADFPRVLATILISRITCKNNLSSFGILLVLDSRLVI